VLPYWLAQFLGAFVAAAIVRITYADLIFKVDPDHTIKTQGIFSTLPGNGLDGVSIPTAFLDQVVGTAILVFVIFAVTTAANNPPMANLGPVVVGLLVVAIGMAWGANAGYAINPARDFGPRLFSYFAGWGRVALPGTYNSPGLSFSNYFWIPIVGPLIGGTVGILLYDLFIGDVLHARLKTQEGVAGPIPESQPAGPPGEGAVPETRQPDASETEAKPARDPHQT
jgi:glycerol uptake facilitator protein